MKDTTGTTGKQPVSQEAEYCSLVPSRVQKTQDLGTLGREMKESTAPEPAAGQEGEGGEGGTLVTSQPLSSQRAPPHHLTQGVTCPCPAGQPKAFASPLSHLWAEPCGRWEGAALYPTAKSLNHSS